ncbi:CotH kinase family protein [Candidatus Saccharibacteria bacterium]|nr:CotH kinase family protein [Candidatus Saccharibacteria bacterium]
MKKLKWFFLILFVSSVLLGINLFVRLNNYAATVNYSREHNLPIMRITLNGVTLEEIENHSKDIKYEGNYLELTEKGMTTSFSEVEIKGRGNSSWSGNKKPFQIKFDHKVDLLGLGPRKKYILLANHFDYTAIRNSMMFKLADMIDEKYRPKGEFVELDIDGSYRGLYYLTTKVEIAKGSVDLRDEYGILVEIDTLHASNENCLSSFTAECLIVEDAVFEDDEVKLKEATDDFVKDFKRLLTAAKEGDYQKVNQLIDLHSFAEYFLISEFAVNPDAYISSFNFYKDGKDDKIHAGPLWDYDLAFGNRNWVWNTTDDFFSPTETMVQREEAYMDDLAKSDQRKLMYYLIDIPEFRIEVEKIYRDKLSGRRDEFLLWMFNEAATVRKAAERNMDRWGRDVNKFYDDVLYTFDWVKQRFDYFEEEYGEKEWIFTPGVV